MILPACSCRYEAVEDEGCKVLIGVEVHVRWKMYRPGLLEKKKKKNKKKGFGTIEGL